MRFLVPLLVGWGGEQFAGTLDRFDSAAPVQGQLEAAHRWAPAWGIAAGTSEIMLYLIAQRALMAGR